MKKNLKNKVFLSIALAAVVILGSVLVWAAAPTHNNPWIGAHNRLDTGRVGEWRFEYGNSTWTYDETGVNNGTVVGANHTDEGRVGKGYEFDGVDDYIAVNKQIMNASEDFAVSVWYKTSHPNNNIVIMDADIDGSWSSDGWTFSYGFFRIADGSSGINTPVFYNRDGNWHHVGVVRDGTDIKVYSDGSLNSTTDISSLGEIGNINLNYIGKRGGGVPEYWNGSIDEIIIWNRSLSVDEIEELYNTSKGAFAYADQDIGCSANNTDDADNDNVKNVINWLVDGSSIAVLNMPFEANNGNEASSTKDYSGNGNNGTVTGATWNSTGGYDGFGAYEFDGDGTGDRIQVSSIINVSNPPYTISMWAKDYNPVSIGTTVLRLFTTSGGSMSIYRDQNDMTMQGYDGISKSCKLVDSVDGNWHHYVYIEFNKSLTIGYVDGVNVCNITNLNHVYAGLQDLNIGQKYSYTSEEWNGSIDEVLILNRSLSAEEVQSIYQSGLSNIVLEETSAGEDWKACLTPNDGISDGTEKCSSVLSITSSCIDNDNDGFGAAGSNMSQCTYKFAYDCNDSNSNIYPGAIEIPNNGIDEDCDGSDDSASVIPYFKDESISSPATYFVGDYIRYRIIYKVNGILTDPYNIVLYLKHSNGTILKTQNIGDMTKESTGNYTGEYSSYDLSPLGAGEGVWLDAYAYSSPGVLADNGVHADEFLDDGSIPTITTSTFSYSTNALSNYTVENLYVSNSFSSVNWSSSRLDFHQRAVNLDSALIFGYGFVSVDSVNWPELNESRFVPFNATVRVQVDGCDTWTIYYLNRTTSSLSDLIANGTVVGTSAAGCNVTLPGDSQPYCSNPVCAGTTLTYNILHFDTTGGDGQPLDGDGDGAAPEFTGIGNIVAIALLAIAGLLYLYVRKKE